VQERALKKPIAKGVMSSILDVNNVFDQIRVMLSPLDRDTANLVANVWPPLESEVVKNGIIEPMLIVATDNGSPFALDLNTLEMKGLLSFVLKDIARVGGPDLAYLKESADAMNTNEILAHARYDKRLDRFIMCKSKFEIPGDDNKGNTVYEFLEFDNTFRLVSSRKYRSRFMVMHDWMITDDYYVVPKNPAKLQWEGVGKFAVGKALGVDIFSMDKESVSELVFIPRHAGNGDDILEVKADNFFTVFHFGPCFQQKNEQIGEGSDIVCYSSIFDSYDFGGEMGFDAMTQEFDPIAWSSGEGAPAPRFDKFIIRDGELIDRERFLLLDNNGDDVPVDMLTFAGDGQKCNFVYGLGASREEGWFPFRSVVKIDTENKSVHNWDAGDDKIVSEPMFLAKENGSNEDDGFVVSIIHDSTLRSCGLMVWKASSFEQGPIAQIDLGELVPWCVHGSWVPGFVSSQ